MTTDPYERVKEVFAEAIALPPEEWPSFLDHACAADAGLRHEVEALLAAHLEPDIALRDVVAGVAADLVSGHAAARNRTIGPYRIVREIGRGGMGVVYEAEREEFHQRVAIKLLPGGPQNAATVERFRQERSILAGLEHPYIARLLDGGVTAEGELYFVMEYIEGQPITDYCRTKKLPVASRLLLFAKVASAVQYAHQNLVVHRDLKPGNILVAEDGTPKLLDFGIAKLLREQQTPSLIEPLTRTGVHLMTPEYASPEQVTGAAITTATDIYSLGVVLYELLTGRRPFQLEKRLLHEVERIICQEEPTKPSTAVTAEEAVTAGEGRPERLRRRLAGDLDNIVLMALRKEPNRRYASVGQFSEDIQRFLDGHPVLAQKDTFRYRARKFLRRHAWAAATVAGLFLLLAAGIVTTSWEARIANHQRVRAETQERMTESQRAIAVSQRQEADLQRARAERRFNDVRRLANSFLFEFHDAITGLAGSTPARRLVVTKALEYLELLSKDAGTDPTLQSEIAAAYERTGDILGGNEANLGDHAGALESYRHALTIRETLAGTHASADAGQRISGTLLRIGDVLRTRGETRQAIDTYNRALADSQTLAPDSKDLDVRRNICMLNERLGEIFAASGETVRAVGHFRKALERGRILVAENPRNREVQSDLTLFHKALGSALQVTGDTKGAFGEYQSALAIHTKLAAADSDNAELQRGFVVLWLELGNVLGSPYTANLGDPAGALKYFHLAVPLAAKLASADPKNISAQNDLANIYAAIAAIHFATGNAKLAAENYQLGYKVLEPLASTGNTWILRNSATNRNQHAENLLALGRNRAALESAEKARQILERVTSGDTRDTQAALELAVTYSYIGAAQGEPRAEVEGFRRSVAIVEKLRSTDPGNQNFERSLGIVYTRLGDALTRSGETGAALEYLERAAAILTRLAADANNIRIQGDLATVNEKLGLLHSKLGHAQEAHAAFSRALPARAAIAGRPQASPNQLYAYGSLLLKAEAGNTASARSAIPYLERAVSLSGRNNPTFLQALAQAYFDGGDRAQAVKTCQEAISLLPPASDERSRLRRELEDNLTRFGSESQ